jgi:hypothetical protein
MRQFAAWLLDPAPVMVEHDPILDHMPEHERSQWPVAGGDGIFPAVRRLI